MNHAFLAEIPCDPLVLVTFKRIGWRVWWHIPRWEVAIFVWLWWDFWSLFRSFATFRGRFGIRQLLGEIVNMFLKSLNFASQSIDESVAVFNVSEECS